MSTCISWLMAPSSSFNVSYSILCSVITLPSSLLTLALLELIFKKQLLLGQSLIVTDSWAKMFTKVTPYEVTQSFGRKRDFLPVRRSFPSQGRNPRTPERSRTGVWCSKDSGTTQTRGPDPGPPTTYRSRENLGHPSASQLPSASLSVPVKWACDSARRGVVRIGHLSNRPEIRSPALRASCLGRRGKCLAHNESPALPFSQN